MHVDERSKLSRKEYEEALRELQTELCSVQDWVKQTGQRIVVVFEGRDAAGKGGTIRAITERVSPRTVSPCRSAGPVRSRKITECTCSVILRTSRLPERS